MDYSPSTSSVSKRLSWGKMVQKLLEFNQLDEEKANKRNSGCLSVDSMEDDPLEEALCAETVANVSDLLTDCSTDLGCSRLDVPHVLLERIGHELQHLAATEPCGIRGAIIEVCIEKSKKHQSVGQISVDPDIVPTFQLTFLLRLDLGGLWPKFTSRLSNSVKLSPGFTVVKRKLYSSEEVYIEEI